jgi:hypothetical protein
MPRWEIDHAHFSFSLCLLFVALVALVALVTHVAGVMFQRYFEVSDDGNIDAISYATAHLQRRLFSLIVLADLFQYCT